MREIKFRGKRIDNGEWVYGDYYKKHVYDIIDGVEKNRLVCYIGFQSFDGKNWWNEYFEVDPKTVSQYTGRKDGNGAEVYEGDFLLFDDEETDNVVWSYSSWWLTQIEDRLDDYACGGEIIGNIHDNPEAT